MKCPTLLFLALPLAAAFAGLLGCQSNEVTGREQLLLFSDARMVELGQAAYAEMTGPGSPARIVTDPAFIRPLEEVGQAIARAANRPDFAWEFRLIDDPATANAWALPGGKIAFYTGIYPILQDRNGMAIVMGHEVMHALLQHGNERMSQATVGELARVAADAALRDARYREEILGALGLGAQVGVLLPYSRRHESEADEQGLYLAARAGFDPDAAIGVWERMAALSGERPPEFLSTHPDPRRRIEDMRRWLPRAREIYAQSVRQPNAPLPAVARPR